MRPAEVVVKLFIRIANRVALLYNWFNEHTHKIGEAVRLKKSKNALLQATGRNSMNKQQLASKIWESANKMRSKIEANE